MDKISCLIIFLALWHSSPMRCQTGNGHNRPFPEKATLSPCGPYFIASVYDTDYLPFGPATGKASLDTPQLSDGIDESMPLNLQGVLTTNGIVVNIPYHAKETLQVPAYSQTAGVPAIYTEDGVGRDVSFSYAATTLKKGAGMIQARLKAIGGTLMIKQLDLQAGIGSDWLGLLLATFTYTVDSKGNTARFELRAIAGIPDRNFADPLHRFLYLPVVSETGSTWLNHNLGADYCNTGKAVFDPSKQPTSPADGYAYGSLFQWGRSADGHELIDWKYGPSGSAVQEITGNVQDAAGDGEQEPAPATGSGLFKTSPDNWNGMDSDNNPCPVGFRLPTQAEWEAEKTVYGITNMAKAYDCPLKLTSTGFNRGRIKNTSAVGNYFSSSIRKGPVLYSYLFFFNKTRAASTFLTQSLKGRSVRCIKD